MVQSTKDNVKVQIEARSCPVNVLWIRFVPEWRTCSIEIQRRWQLNLNGKFSSLDEMINSRIIIDLLTDTWFPAKSCLLLRSSSFALHLLPFSIPIQDISPILMSILFFSPFSNLFHYCSYLYQLFATLFAIIFIQMAHFLFILYSYHHLSFSGECFLD